MNFKICLILVSYIFLFHKSSYSMGSPEKSISRGVFSYDRFSKVRGGTTKGPEVTHDYRITKEWKNLIRENGNKKDKDISAIMTLVGGYKATFEFLETINFDVNKKLDTPYNSWGTEFVHVIYRDEQKISLQHIMVMSFIDPKTNKVTGPMVMKRWRQDWEWEGRSCLTYIGDGKWSKEPLSEVDVRGKWVWHVYQVDDSPRYCGVGQWEHYESASIFKTSTMQRPLPRRERTIRGDYNVLLGEDTIITTPSAWFHEQRNFKQNKDIPNVNPKDGWFLSREIGHNSYQRIRGYDFSTGKEYWEKTSLFWSDVRSVWASIIDEFKYFKLRKKINNEYMFSTLFQEASNKETLKMGTKERKDLIKKIILRFISPLERKS